MVKLGLLLRLCAICCPKLERGQNKKRDRDQSNDWHSLVHHEDKESENANQSDPEKRNRPLRHLLLQCEADVEMAFGIDFCGDEVWSFHAVVQAVDRNVGADDNIVSGAQNF